jgi:2-polyprenyl-3-methyl-5-hydroxy-6-metoxy-1,4-benzoquinol methylase
MYSSEGLQNYDSWEQSDMNKLENEIAFLLINQYSFEKILDIGCGKGYFTSYLKKRNNRVLGIDCSKSAVEKSRMLHKNVNFEVQDMQQDMRTDYYDLIVLNQSIYYIENWRTLLRVISNYCKYCFISFYEVEKPKTHIRCYKELKDQILLHYNIKDEIYMKSESNHLLLLESKKYM